MNDCIFCKIIDKAEPASVIVENEQVMALMSLFPFSEGHCLVIPKQHFASLEQLDEEVGQAIFKQVQRLAQCIGEVVTCEWIQIMMHDDVLKGAELLEPFHLHFHLLPRQKDIAYTDTPTGHRPPMASRNELDTLADKIKKVYVSKFSVV